MTFLPSLVDIIIFAVSSNKLSCKAEVTVILLFPLPAEGYTDIQVESEIMCQSVLLSISIVWLPPSDVK